jgi:predicted nuclease of predicted toxin-antitoxin system
VIHPTTEFLVVVDESLAPQLGAHCKGAFRTASGLKTLTIIPFADSEILRNAELNDTVVLSLDFYRDHRRSNPWIDGSSTRFIGWKASGTDLVFGFREMGVPSDFSKTRAEEVAEFKGRGINASRPEVREALRNAFRCDTSACWVHRYDPGRFTGVPNLSDVRNPKCPSCGQKLVNLGEAPKLVQLKLTNTNQTRLERLTLAPGGVLEIGRESNRNLLSSLLGNDFSAISRRHALFNWNGETLTCIDLGSSNGTKRIPWNSKDKKYDDSVTVSNLAQVLKPRDEIQIGRVLRVTRSAREFLLDDVATTTEASQSINIPTQTLRHGG